jgi:hypothetical protein
LALSLGGPVGLEGLGGVSRPLTSGIPLSLMIQSSSRAPSMRSATAPFVAMSTL